MNRLCVAVLVVLGIFVGGCKPNDEKSAAAAFDRFLAACRNDDANAMTGMLTGAADEAIHEQPQRRQEFARMFQDAKFTAKRIDDRTIELACDTRRDDRSVPTVVVMTKVGGDWKLSDMRIGQDNSLRAELGRHNRMIQCGFQLRKIGDAILAYQSLYSAWPPSLRFLVEKRRLVAINLKLPGTPADRDCDYFYVPPTAQAFIIACNLADNQGETRTVFCRDGNVLRMGPAEFDKKMNEPAHAEFAKALAAAENR